jgi:beta-N-acetylhexosaminidase
MGQWVRKTLKEMTLEDKVGQLLCVRILKWLPQVEEILPLGHIGGAYINRGDEATNSPITTAEFTNRLQELSKVPLLLTCGHEGNSRVVKGFTRIGRAMAIGATRSPEHVKTWAQVMARECKAVGIPWIDAPVLDVNINPINPIINTRSFGERADMVSEISAQVVEILKEERTLSTAKHFPGHGDTSVDSHISTPVVPFGRTRLDSVELYPYKESIACGLDTIMTAHIRFPEVDPTNLPATLSRPCITGLLREEMGFHGIIITDSMTMKGIKTEYGIEKAAVMALQAGHDMILHDYESDPRITYNALLEAVRDGLVPMAQVEASVCRILRAKEWLGLHTNRFVDPEVAEEIVGCKEHKEAALKIGCDSITVLEGNGFPLKGSSNKKVLLVYTQDKAGPSVSPDLGSEVRSYGEAVANELRDHFTCVEEVMVFDSPEPEQRAMALAKAAQADLVVFASFVPLAAYKAGSGAIPEVQAEFVKALKAQSKHLTIIIYGPPYVLSLLPKADISVCAYGDSPAALKGSIIVLCGVAPARGKLPVTLSPEYPFGAGIITG